MRYVKKEEINTVYILKIFKIMFLCLVNILSYELRVELLGKNPDQVKSRFSYSGLE